MSMNTKAQQRLNAAFTEAESCGSCLVPGSEADAVALKRRCAKGEVLEPAPGVYARPSYWRALAPDARAMHIMHGLGIRHESWAFKGSSAALAWGLDIPYPLMQPVQIGVGRIPLMRADSIAFSFLSEVPTETVEGVRVTAFWDSVIDCLLTAPFSWGLAVADSALRCTGAGTDRLVELVRELGKGRHGVHRALITASFADGRVESGGESRVRAFLIVNGFQMPELQVQIEDPVEPGRMYRTDFFWKLRGGLCVLGEMDGICKYEDEAMLGGRTALDALVDERQRESRLTLAGYPVLRFTFDDLEHPQQLERKLLVAGIPRDEHAAERWRNAWRQADPQGASGR